MKKAQIYDELHSASFIYLCQLCEDDCITILDKNEINIVKGKKIILKEHRRKTYGICYIPISRPVRHCDLAIITRDKTKTKLIK